MTNRDHTIALGPDSHGFCTVVFIETDGAAAIVAAWARPLRAGIDSLVAVFDPQRVLLGGGLGAAAVAALARFPAASRWYQCEVAPAELGDRAGAIGAALAALERAP